MGHWTDIPTEVMATSTICNQNSVNICSLAVNMNNTDESFFITVGVLKDVRNVDYNAAVNLSGKEQSPYCSTCVAVADFSSRTEMLPVECGVVD